MKETIIRTLINILDIVAIAEKALPSTVQTNIGYFSFQNL